MPMNDAELHDWENASDAEKVKIAQRVKARYAAAVAKLSPEWDRVISTLEQRASDNLKISCGDCIVTVSFADWEGTPTILVEGPSALIGYAHIGGDWRDGYELEAFAKASIRGRKEFEELFPGIGLPASLPEAIRRAGGAPPKVHSLNKSGTADPF
jgi:hypothetical protein